MGVGENRVDAPESDPRAPDDGGEAGTLDTPLAGARDVIDAVADVARGVDPCGSAHVIDVNVRGTRTENTTRISAENTIAPASPARTAPCGDATNAQVAFRYTPRVDAVLRVRVDNAADNADLDTIAWALDACGDTIPRTLGCSVDGERPPRPWEPMFDTAAPVRAGTAVYLLVAGNPPPSGATRRTQGRFTFEVTEVPLLALGAACDPTRIDNLCAEETVCVTRGSTSTCVNHGSAGAPCRMTTPACDDGFLCSTAPRECVPARRAGETCDPTRRGDVCDPSLTCVTTGGASRCVAPGEPGGLCSSASYVSYTCQGGSVCEGAFSGDAFCVTALPLGAACNPSRTSGSPICGSGLRCATHDASSVCERGPYALSTIASPEWIDACASDAGAPVAFLIPRELDDNLSGAMTFPWPVRLGGATHREFWVTTNGWLSVDISEHEFLSSFPLLPYVYVSDRDAPYLSPMNRDLVLPPTGAGVCSATVGTSPSRRFVIAWQNMRALAHPMTRLDFEVVIHEGTHVIDFIYDRLDSGAPSDLGFVNGTGAILALHDGSEEVRHVGAVAPRSGLRFTPVP